MKTTETSLKLFLNLHTTQAILAKKFDARLSMLGISLSEFMILYHLQHAPEEKMRRIDLAHKIGMSASGVTRMLAPMEKIGLVQKEANARDARVRLVKLTATGQRVFEDGKTTMEEAAEWFLTSSSEKEISQFLDMLRTLGGNLI